MDSDDWALEDAHQCEDFMSWGCTSLDDHVAISTSAITHPKSFLASSGMRADIRLLLSWPYLSFLRRNSNAFIGDYKM